MRVPGSMAAVLAAAASLLLLWAAASTVQAQQDKAQPAQAWRIEKVSFLTNVVEDTTNDEDLRVPARLYLPTSVRGRHPAVVIVPSSGGVEAVREIYYAEELARAGIAALVVDSFAARDVSSSVEDQSLMENWDVEQDALAALRFLAADSRINSQRIAIMGVSKGGTVARDSALVVRRKWADAGRVMFAAHIAISPDCVWTNRSTATTGAPILFLLAELDDQTPAEPCRRQALRYLAAGNPRVETKLYVGAHHAWEELGPAPRYGTRTENYSNCRVWIEDDGSMISADTGEIVPEKKWRDWARKTCMTLGATCCGGTPGLKEAATRDIISFLHRHGFRR